MRTIQQLNEYFKANKIGFNVDYGYTFNVGGIIRTNGWGDKYFEGGIHLSFEVSQSTYCCGIMEMGCFNGADLHSKHWEAALEYMLRKEKLKYLRTETITQKSTPCKALEAALKAVGFRLVTTVPSEHGKREGQHYKIKVWEWLRK